MSLKKKQIYSFFVLLLLLVNAAGTIRSLIIDIDTPALPHLLAGIALIATISALYYAFRGFKKYAAPAYKAYMIICAVFFQTLCVGNAINLSASQMGKPGLAAVVMTNSLIFGLFLLLGVAKDMGKKLTYTICGIAQILTFVDLILFVFIAGRIDGAAISHFLGSRGLTRFLLVTVACFMAGLKYADKAERGSK